MFVTLTYWLTDAFLAPDQKQWLSGGAVPPADWEGRGISGQWLILDRHLVSRSNSYYQASPHTVPLALLSCPFGHISSVLFTLSSFPSCWYDLLGKNSSTRQGRKVMDTWASDFSLKLIHSLVGNPSKKAADPLHPCPHHNMKGSPVSGERHGTRFPSISSAAPTVQVQLRWSWASVEAQVGGSTDNTCIRPAIPSQRWPRRGLESWSLSSFSCYLPPSPKRWLHQKRCLEVWPVLHGHSTRGHVPAHSWNLRAFCDSVGLGRQDFSLNL